MDINNNNNNYTSVPKKWLEKIQAGWLIIILVRVCVCVCIGWFLTNSCVYFPFNIPEPIIESRHIYPLCMISTLGLFSDQINLLLSKVTDIQSRSYWFFFFKAKRLVFLPEKLLRHQKHFLNSCPLLKIQFKHLFHLHRPPPPTSSFSPSLWSSSFSPQFFFAALFTIRHPAVIDTSSDVWKCWALTCTVTRWCTLLLLTSSRLASPSTP